MATETLSGSNPLDVIVDPADALERVTPGGVWWPALVLLALFLLGGFLQLPAVRHIELATGAGTPGDVSARQVWSSAFTAGQFLQWLFAYGFVFAGLLIGAAMATAGAVLAGGQAGYRRYLTATVLIAVPCLGLYGLTTGIVSVIDGPNSYVKYDDLALAVPNLMWLMPFVKNEFARGALASLNPFAVWALALYRTMFRSIGTVAEKPAWGLAAMLTILGAVAQGVLAAIST